MNIRDIARLANVTPGTVSKVLNNYPDISEATRQHVLHKFVGKNNLEETIFQVNEQAANEIAKQIRLRDIGGIILIDFIDMYTDEHKKKIINIMKEKTKACRIRQR